MKIYTVVIVEDYVLLSQAMSSLINSFEQFDVLCCYKNGGELIENIRMNPIIPNIILMDVQTPAVTHINTTNYVKKNYPTISVIGISMDRNEETVISMIRAGAASYLFKDEEKSTLETAFKEVMEYGYYHTRAVSNILMKTICKTYDTVKLKAREKEFMKHACSELTYREIAEKMYRSPKTIDGYRDNLFEKLHLKNRVGLVLYAIKNKIFTP